MQFWHALVQIVAEVFPVSSSSHVRLLEKIFSLDSVPSSIDGLLHLPMLVILLLFYAQPVWVWIHADSLWIKKTVKAIWWGFCASVSMSVIVGILLALRGAPLLRMPLWGSFLVTALWLVALKLVQNYVRRDVSLNMWRALVIGCVQGLSYGCGFSRLASTFVTGRMLGLSADKAFWFSWWIDLPVMAFGIFREGFFEIYRASSDGCAAITFFSNYLVIAMVIMLTVVGYGCFVLSARMANRDQLWWWSVYLILPLTIAVYSKI